MLPTNTPLPTSLVASVIEPKAFPDKSHDRPQIIWQNPSTNRINRHGHHHLYTSITNPRTSQCLHSLSLEDSLGRKVDRRVPHTSEAAPLLRHGMIAPGMQNQMPWAAQHCRVNGHEPKTRLTTGRRCLRYPRVSDWERTSCLGQLPRGQANLACRTNTKLTTILPRCR